MTKFRILNIILIFSILLFGFYAVSQMTFDLIKDDFGIRTSEILVFLYFIILLFLSFKSLQLNLKIYHDSIKSYAILKYFYLVFGIWIILFAAIESINLIDLLMRLQNDQSYNPPKWFTLKTTFKNEYYLIIILGYGIITFIDGLKIKKTWP